MLDACAALQPSLLLHQGVCPERSQQLALSRICLGPDGEGAPVSALRFEGEHNGLLCLECLSLLPVFETISPAPWAGSHSIMGFHCYITWLTASVLRKTAQI